MAVLQPQSNEAAIRSRFRRAFGQEFDPEAYRADPNNYLSQFSSRFGRSGRANVIGSQETDERTSLQEIREYYDRFAPIDTQGIFDPVREGITEQGEHQRTQGTTAIQRAAEKAEKGVTAQLAATGRGFSGVSDQAFSELGTAQTLAQASLEENIRGRELELQTKVDEREAELRYADDLRVAQWKEEDVRSAIEFKRMLLAMDHENELRKDFAEFEDNLATGWGDSFGAFANFAIEGLNLYLDYQTLGSIRALQAAGQAGESENA